MKKKIRIIYVGYHIETLLLLYGDKSFDVVGTGLIEEFLSVNTLNPVNHLFKLIYGLRQRNKYRLLERILLRIWILTSRFATSFYYRYRDYLKGISKYRTAIINIGNRSETIDYLESNNVDLMVVNVWAILPEEIISLPKFGTVNIHPSKLPQYCGALPTLWSLKNGDKESALTYQIMDKAIDAGAIIGQHSFAISEVDDWISVEAIINEILQANFLSDLKGYIAGEIKPVAQNIQIRSNTDKYYEYMEIDWDKENCKDIYNKINLYPYFAPDEFCYTFLSGKKIEIKKADFINSRFVLTKLGQYYVQGLTLFIQAKVGVITCKLFSGVRIKDSFLFILKRKGDFIR